MNEAMDKLNYYLDELRNQGKKVPAHKLAGEPHIKTISAASEVPFRFFSAQPFTQRIALASQESGFERWKSPEYGKPMFQQNCSLMSSYLKSLEAQGFKLPEHPGLVVNEIARKYNYRTLRIYELLYALAYVPIIQIGNGSFQWLTESRGQQKYTPVAQTCLL